VFEYFGNVEEEELERSGEEVRESVTRQLAVYFDGKN
jgi:hypothetical protein